MLPARPLAAMLLFLLLIGATAAALPPPAAGLARQGDEQLFPARALRGYGTLTGHLSRYALPDGATASSLLIDCADEAHARLTAAKFASDLLAPLAAATGTLAPQAVADAPVVWQVPGPGWLAVRQQGQRVALLSATTAPALAALIQVVGWPAAPLALDTIPPYLNAWDRSGFRFYYRTWELPGKHDKWADYPVLKEFDFVRASGNAGLVFWANAETLDTGPALVNTPWWDWAARAAARRQSPFIINTMANSPTWLLNRFRAQVMPLAPQYCGGSHGVATTDSSAQRQFSWCATTGNDAELALTQQLVKTYAPLPNVLEFLEPHGELDHGSYDLLLEYGPLADANYRTYLQAQYATVAAVAQRWYGDAARLRTWDDVHVPELAAFLGWDAATAFDLTGTWRLVYESSAEGAEAATKVSAKPTDALPGDDLLEDANPANRQWYHPQFDDTAWGSLTAPGHDRQMFMAKAPALLRRTFELPAAWLAQGPRTWLYVWDLNFGGRIPGPVRAYCNGQPVGSDEAQREHPHWGAYEVTAQLRGGRNVVALALPQAYLGYRVYLSHAPPLQYPALGPQRNAQWVDFIDWRRATRTAMVRQGMEMIRQVDPDRSIICMSPDTYTSSIRALDLAYGGHFHNTGHMGGFWNDFLPMLMRGADLPMSVEPGGPAADLNGFKNMMGLYFTEGVQAVHYFIHVGNILWPEDIRAHFEQIQPLVQTIGKVHPPKAQVAMLLSDRTASLTTYPWGSDYNTNLPTGYWGWRFSDALGTDYHVDAVTELDFAPGGPADAYRVVIDTNTAVMTPATVEAIAGWVRRGGIFVTMIQTGRHTPEEPDSWPISALTGYRVTHVDKHRPDGGEGATRGFRLAPDQPLFAPGDWSPNTNWYANGQSLVKVAPECQDLLVWGDTTVAAGLRPLGQGFVVNMGLKFGTGRGGGGGNYQKLLTRILEWAKIAPLAAQAKGVILRHSVSNNGLYDVWTLWNTDREQPVTTKLVWRSGTAPQCENVLTGQTIAGDADLTVPPLETRILLSPRQPVATAPLDWFTLQRGWWQGTTRPAGPPLVVPPTPNDLSLTDDWACQVLSADKDDQAALAAPALDDTAWPRRPLTCWAVGEELPSPRVFFRKRFTVPATWTNGTVTLWQRSFFSSTIAGTAKVWLDGEEITVWDGHTGIGKTLSLVPGSTHVLALEVRADGQVGGVRGNTWLHYTPAPRAQLDLAGQWLGSRDLLHAGTPITVPGIKAGVRSVRRTFSLPADWPAGQVYLSFQGGYSLFGALVNGHYVARHGDPGSDTTLLNITPLLRPAGDNEVEFILGGDKNDHLDRVQVLLYDPQQEL